MKQLFTLFAAAFLALVPAAAANNNDPESVKMETKTYQVESFDGLEVSWIYHVNLSKSSSQKVEVEAPDFVMPYLTVKVRNNTLILGCSGLPADARRKLERGSYKVQASVALPELTHVEMSGASKMVADGDFKTRNFDLELSGATSLKELQMTADFANLRCSGASKFQMKGDLKEIKLDLSGASKGVLEAEGKEIDMDLSGSAKLELTGGFDQMRSELSAASHLWMKGTLGSFRLSGSGAAKADLTECATIEARVEMSGASSVRIYALEKLGVDLSGAASCRYKAGDKLQITETDIDRGATLKKL
jgi:hypothetical protein